MVRNYVRKLGSRRYRDYSEEQLEEALERIRNGDSARQIGEEYGIPCVTLYRKIKGLHPKRPGGQTILAPVEEQSIVECIVQAAEWLFPMSSEEIKCLVQNYLNERDRRVEQFHDNKPGEGWIENFLKRHHKVLSKRLSQSIKESRAKINHETINKYFDRLAVELEGISPEALVNYDETNFTDDPGRIKVVVRRSSKRAEQMIDTSKSATSVMFSCSASGVLLPIYVVYKADHLWSTWMESGPPKARYNRSKSGWFDTNLFEDWFFSIIVPYFQTLPDGPKALIGDNLASHLSIKVIRKCGELNIRFILLPPNSTQLTQPLDVCVFRPIKGAWRIVLREWKKHNRGVVRKEVFPRLLNQALNNIQRKTEANIKAGFESTGICPLNREKVLNKLPEEVDRQAVDPAMANSMTDMFKKARFNNGETSARGRKKKLNIEPGKSVSETDLIPDATTAKPSKKQKGCITEDGLSARRKQKPKQKKYTIDSSSESDADVLVEYADSDLDPFSDLEDDDIGANQQMTENDIVTDMVLSKEDYVLVSMKNDSGTTKENVAKIISIEENDSYFCTFLRRSLKIKNAFTFPSVEDTGIVQRNEVLEKLAKFEVLRRGQIQFKQCHKLETAGNLA